MSTLEESRNIFSETEMKIVHVLIGSGFFNEKYAYQDNTLPKYHRKQGHDVTIIAPVYSGFDKNTGIMQSSPEGVRYLDDGIKLIRLKPDLPYKLTEHVHLYHGMAAAVENEAPDLIFAHAVSSLNYRFFVRYKIKHPLVKIVFDNHADWVNSCHNFLSKNYSRHILRPFLTRKLVKISDFFYGVTPARCNFLYEMFDIPKDKIHLLPLGADDEEMHFEDKESIREEVRNLYGIANDEFLIVTGGKIDPLKNIHVLAEAVRNSKIKKIKILIFGSIRDDMIEVFDNLTSDRVQCIGWVPSNEVYRYFYAADIVMFPGLHSVLWEQAVASQVPCAFSRIKGFEHIDIGGNCVLMEGKTVDYYQPLIERLYSDKAYYGKLYDCAHSDRSQQFLYSQIANKVIMDCFGKNEL